MQHFIGILAPNEKQPVDDAKQKPFFGPEWRLTRAERDAAVLAGKWPGDWGSDGEHPERGMRFVSLLSPPFI